MSPSLLSEKWWNAGIHSVTDTVVTYADPKSRHTCCEKE
jgi:hypothetical protein